MFNWFKKNNNVAPLLSPSDLQQWTGEIKAARSRFVGEVNQLLAETEEAFNDFDQGMDNLREETATTDKKLADRLAQIDSQFSN